MYDVLKVQMLLPGRWVSAGAFLRNYSATNVAFTQTNPSSRRRGNPISEHINGLRTNIFRSWVLTMFEIKNDCAGEAS
jgi:hypothetical protein